MAVAGRQTERIGLARQHSAVPGLLASLVAVVAVACFFTTRHALSRTPDQNVQAIATAEASAIVARLDARAQLLAAASEAVAGDALAPTGELTADLRRVGPPSQIIGIARTAPDGSVTVVATSTPQGAPSTVGANLAAVPEWRLVLQLARDGAAAHAAAGTAPNGLATVLVALPLFGTSTPPGDVSDRRTRLDGYAFTLDPPSSLSGGADAGANHLATRFVQADTVLSSTGVTGRDQPPANGVVVPITTHGVSWAVQAWSTRPASTLPWVILGGGLAVAGLIALVTTRRERSITAIAEEAKARADELSLVARTGPLLQRSFELGDLLPAFVVEIADELHLDGVSISLATSDGRMMQSFSMGTGSLATPDEVPVPTTSSFVTPGGSVCLPLQRAGRDVGLLSARARLGLRPSQMDTLRAVCDLLAAAVGNALLYREEQEMVARLRDLNVLKSTFVSSVSHELRTTTTAIVGFAGLLSEPPPTLTDEDRADFIERISRNARSMGTLVEDLLDFARLERTTVSIKLQPVDLSDLVPRIVGQLSPILDHHPVKLKIAPDVEGWADPSAIERILANLLSNAAKYTPPGSEVTVNVDRKDGQAMLCVADRGPGIPADERERIFDLFYRVDNELVRGTRGIGIGLALVRQLVELLHGSIVADEAPGGGARFRVTLPVAGPSPPPS